MIMESVPSGSLLVPYFKCPCRKIKIKRQQFCMSHVLSFCPARRPFVLTCTSRSFCQGMVLCVCASVSWPVLLAVISTVSVLQSVSSRIHSVHPTSFFYHHQLTGNLRVAAIKSGLNITLY